MHEIVVNLHMHTTYSDGTGSHDDIGQAALTAGLDAVIVTDHNVLVQGVERYYKQGPKRALLLVGEEIHDQARLPQKSHLLVFNAGRELATYAANPQRLIDAVRQEGGLCFLAHPFERAAPSIHETAITWDDWHVNGYTGIELWNGLSEIKDHIPTKLHALFYALFPELIAHAPHPETLSKWDELLAAGKRVVAVGGSDAHALKLKAGPLRRTVFPYTFHFRTINTHLYLAAPLSGDLAADKKLIYDALASGHAFVGYDLPASTRGLMRAIHTEDGTGIMGDELTLDGSFTLQVHTPQNARIRLIRNGQVIKQVENRQVLTHITTEPGVYRAEAYRPYMGKMRGWIFSNPIYVRERAETAR